MLVTYDVWLFEFNEILIKSKMQFFHGHGGK